MILTNGLRAILTGFILFMTLAKPLLSSTVFRQLNHRGTTALAQLIR
ncbi:hypothetical protein [Bosea sp. Tri-44]|nr:hypothetical protein [Bosea sp. Tri-44]